MSTPWFCALGLALLLLPGLRADEASSEGAGWSIFLYGSYDNNLAPAGPAIRQQLAAAVARVGGAVRVRMLEDDPDPNGLKRYRFQPDGSVVAETLQTDDACDPNLLVTEIRQFLVENPGRRTVVVLLNHGGDVDQLCSDEDAGRSRDDPRWMSGRALANTMRRHRLRPDLLFFQQCGRASLENLYEFRDSAPWLMASSLRVGSPNTWYAAGLAWCAANPTGSVVDLASSIAASDQHYISYSLVRSATLHDLPQRLRTALTGLDPTRSQARPPAIFDGEYGEAAMLDVGMTLNALGVAAPNQRWFREELVHRHWTTDLTAVPLCGLSWYVPIDVASASRHQASALHQALALDQWWSTWLTQQQNWRISP